MAARSSCYAAAVVGRNLKAGGCPLFCVLPPSPLPLLLRGRILSRQSAPAAQLGCRKCKKIKQPLQHQTPIPQNGGIMLPAQFSALPFFPSVLFLFPSLPTMPAFFPFVLFLVPSNSPCMSSTHAEVMTPPSNGFVSRCIELFSVWRKWGQPRMSGALKSYQII
ncbi:hypothetical protein BGZ57DRAFT_902876 [Hyaloscypha finlandica]|nr:hypothetical protein BGZ57DRAFT_902876 [Hyaloscypha finlandica]